MAVFFDHKVKSPVQGQFTDIQWHKTAPLLAIACVAEPTKSGIVSLFMEEVTCHTIEAEIYLPRPFIPPLIKSHMNVFCRETMFLNVKSSEQLTQLKFVGIHRKRSWLWAGPPGKFQSGIKLTET